jgi:type IV pilus assembly protein PilE
MKTIRCQGVCMFKHAGITLIELMIAVAIVAILAGIAYPSYSTYVRNSRRTEAQSMLVRISNLEERYYLDNNQYGSLFQLGLTATSTATYTTENGYYSITIGTSGATYTLTATAAGSQATDTECATFTLIQTGAKSSSSSNSCWN